MQRIKKKLLHILNLDVSISSSGSNSTYAHKYPTVDIQPGCIISLDCEIGAYSYIGLNTTITKSFIGRFCSIANNVSIGDGEHTLSRISTNSHFYENAYEELTKHDCVIGNDVWIGTKSIIRRGVKIGNGAVVGANSFVNKDVPDFAIVVGTPAKIIKYRFQGEPAAIILDSNWWELNLEDARKKIIELETAIKECKC